MSVPALYRVMVRMLYDVEFTRAVYTDRAAALAGIDLAPTERDWLVAADSRAWRTDGMRRMRSLTGLIEEFPVSAAFAMRHGREGVVRPESAPLDAFFSHAIFHRCLQEGGSIVFAFGRYLEEPSHCGVPSDPRVAPLVQLETVIARLRRVRDPRSTEPGNLTGGAEMAGMAGATGPAAAAGSADPAGTGVRVRDVAATPSDTLLRLAPWAELIALPAGTSELHARVAKALRAKDRQPVAAALDRRWSLPLLLDLDFALEEHLLVERPPVQGVPWAECGVRQAPITNELAGLLRAAAPGATRERLMAAARDLGAEAGDEAEIVDGLVAEGVLAADPPPGRPS